MQVVKPVFRIFDYEKAKEFYLGWLGFKIDWEHRFDENKLVYMQVSLGNLKLHLSEHSNSCSPGGHFHIENFEGLSEYHEKLLSVNSNYNKPGIGKAEWDNKLTTMEVIDPFRNVITFSEEKEYIYESIT